MLRFSLPWQTALLHTELLGGVAPSGPTVQGHRLPGDEQVGHPACLLFPRLGEAGRGGEGVGGAGEDEAGSGRGEGG